MIREREQHLFSYSFFMKTAFANELIDKKYGGILRRIAAYSIDCVLLLFGVVVLQIILLKINPLIATMRNGQQPTPTQVHLWVFLTATTPFVVYFALFVWSSRRATIGMRLFRLKIEDANGGSVGLGRSFLRSVVMFIPFELNHTVMFHLGPRGGPPSPVFVIGIVLVWVVIAIYIGSILATKQRQSLHDLAAGTVVCLIPAKSTGYPQSN